MNKSVIVKTLLAAALLSTSLSAKDHVVEQKDKDFKPKTLKVKVGDTVTFKNHDGFAHNAFSDNEENEFDIGMQKPNQDITITMKAKSTVEVECAIHPNMTLTIEVE